MTRVANNLKTVLVYAWTAFLLLFSIDVSAVPERPEPARFVNDLALMFDQSQAETLEKRLAVYSDTTTTQIVVVTVPDLEGQDAASYATELVKLDDKELVMRMTEKGTEDPDVTRVTTTYMSRLTNFIEEELGTTN